MLNSAPTPETAADQFSGYARRLSAMLSRQDWSGAIALADELLDCWRTGRQVFLIGNGGSAATAIHLANEFVYPVSKRKGSGIRAHALLANAAAITCLANDEGYDQVFAYQLAALARPGDVLIAFSGSGNSRNILVALEEARQIGMRSFALVGMGGGQAKNLADVAVHFPDSDMQLAEDGHMIVGHMVLQYLHARRDDPGL